MSTKSALVYVVDDDASVREAVESLVRSAGLRVGDLCLGAGVFGLPRPDVPSCLVLDVQLPGLSGLDLQQELAKADVQIPIIFLTGHGDIPMSVRAIKAGALEFLTKPFDDEDLLKAIQQGIARDHRAAAAAGETSRSITSNEIVGTSAAIEAVLDQVEVVAPTDSTVLINGETGTGKELIARAIHNVSSRSNRAFVKLNCAAIPTGLLESELFGHEKGAFTGAVAQRIGRFELADGGTCFSTKLVTSRWSCSPSCCGCCRSKNLSAWEARAPFESICGWWPQPTGICRRWSAEKQFREDLYYRLNVFPIRVPPLRERAGDIPLLVRHYVRKYAQRMNKRIETIPEESDGGTLPLYLAGKHQGVAKLDRTSS